MPLARQLACGYARSSPLASSPRPFPMLPPNSNSTPRSNSGIGGLSPGGGFCGPLSDKFCRRLRRTTDQSSTSAAAPGPIWRRWRKNIAASESTRRPTRFVWPSSDFRKRSSSKAVRRTIWAGSVDEARLVLMMDVLEHVPDDFALFSAVAAAVQPGTFLLITVPADLRLWTGHDESFGHYRRYDARRLAKIWEDLPIEPLLVSHFNRRLYPLIKGVRAVNRWRGPDRRRRPGGNRLQNSARAGQSAAGKHLRRRSPAFSAGRCEPAGAGYRKGVSLMALLQRKPGQIDVREKPARHRGRLFRSRRWPAGRRVKRATLSPGKADVESLHRRTSLPAFPGLGATTLDPALPLIATRAAGYNRCGENPLGSAKK